MKLTFSEAKRSVDLAVRRGQLPDFQREGAMFVARTNPSMFRKLVAASPIDVDERKFVGTVRPAFRSVASRGPEPAPVTCREVFSHLGIIDAGWNPRPSW